MEPGNTTTPEPKPEPACECTVKEHDKACDCQAAGTDKCDCTIKAPVVIPVPTCECTEKEHDTACDCPVAGTDKCDCTIKTPVIVPDPTCECTEKEHDAACDCSASGTDKCDCTIKAPVVVPDPTCACQAGTEHKYDETCCNGTDCACPVYYGEVVGLTFNGNNVKVYKKAGANISDPDMLAAILKLQEGYNNNPGIINDKIKESHLTDNGNYHYHLDLIFDLYYGKSATYMGNRLIGITNDNLNPGDSAMINQNNSLKLAKVPTLRQLVAFQRSQQITRARIGQVAHMRMM
jgi:hypothetical protein